MRDQEHFLARLDALEQELLAAGLPEPPGTWWRDEIRRFYRSGKRRWVVRKGRRVFASTAIAPRLAVAELLFGEHQHIPGTPPLVYAFVSIKREEAGDRLAGVTAVLDAIGIKYGKAGQTIQLTDFPAVIKVVTASQRTSVGQTVAFCWCDEVSRWMDNKLGANPAEDIVAAIAPSLTTLPDARMILVSSPLTTADFHAREFDAAKEGDALRHWAFGETWVINPTLTEEDTHREEPNLRKWLREYAAQPQDGIEEDWFGAAVDAAISDEPPWGVRNGMQPIFTIDPAFAHDYFGWSVVTTEPLETEEGEPPRRLTIVHASGARAPDGEPRKMLEWFRDRVVKPYMHEAGNDNGTAYVHTDQAEFYSLREVARSVGLTLLLVPWTGGSGENSKLTRFRAVRTAMLGGDVRIQRRPELVRQFRSVSGVLLPSGNERIEYARTGQGHCDELSAVVQGISLALESSPRAAKPVEQPALADDPRKWREDAIKKVAERRAREMKRSPGAVYKKAMGL